MSEERNERIDRLLKALGEAEAPAGMERRVLARLEDASTAKDRVGWGWAVRGAAVAAVVCVAVVVPMQLRPRRVVVKKNDVIAAVSKPEAVAVEGNVMTRKSVRSGKAVRRVVVARAGGNHPAPAMPLTEEERLLLQIAHRGEAKEYELLDQGKDAEEQAEFKDFFADPPFLITPTATSKTENNQ